MSDDKKDEPGKDLVSAIQTQQKALFVAGLALVLFWLSPRSNELLRAGQAELDKKPCDECVGQMQQSIRSLSAGRCARATILESMTAARFDTKRVSGGAQKASAACDSDASGGGATSSEEADGLLSVVGVAQPSTLGDYERLSSGEVFYCSPRVEPLSMAGLAILRGRTDTFTAKGMELRAVTDAEAVTFAKGFLAKSIATAQQLTSDSPSDAGADAGTRLKPSPRPQPRIGTIGGKETIIGVDEAALQRWLAEQEAIDKEKNEATKARLVAEKAAKELKEAASSLRMAMNDLDRAVHMQVSPGKADSPRFLFVRVEVEGVKGEDGTMTDFVAFSIPCEPKALSIPNARALTPSLVLTPDWKELKDTKPDGARRVVAASVRKGGETIELAGLKIHEDELVRFGPLLLTGLWLWHLLHVVRLRRVPQAVEGAGNAALLPTFPAKQNIYLPIVTAALTLTAMGFFAFRSGAELLAIGFAAGCALVAIATVVVIQLGAPRVKNLPEVRPVPDLEERGAPGRKQG